MRIVWVRSNVDCLLPTSTFNKVDACYTIIGGHALPYSVQKPNTCGPFTGQTTVEGTSFEKFILLEMYLLGQHHKPDPQLIWSL